MAFDATSRVLTVAGDLDEEPIAALRDFLGERGREQGEGLVVDLSGVTYLPSAAVGVLARETQNLDAAGVSLELAAAAGSVAQRVLTVCAMAHRAY
jgi:anti-anti-sigma factor